jgi:hypothetical protein
MLGVLTLDVYQLYINANDRDPHHESSQPDPIPGDI